MMLCYHDEEQWQLPHSIGGIVKLTKVKKTTITKLTREALETEIMNTEMPHNGKKRQLSHFEEVSGLNPLTKSSTTTKPGGRILRYICIHDLCLEN